MFSHKCVQRHKDIYIHGYSIQRHTELKYRDPTILNHVRKHKENFEQRHSKKNEKYDTNTLTVTFLYDIYRCLKILNFQNGCHYHLNKKIKISYISMFNAEKLHIKRTLVQIIMEKVPTDAQMTFWGSRSLDRNV